MNVINTLKEKGENRKNKIALIEKKMNGFETITFENFWNDVKKTAILLKSLGVKKGDRVVVLIPASIILYKVIFGLYYIGASSVFLDAWSSEERLKIACQITCPYAVIGDTLIFEKFKSIKDLIPTRFEINQKLIDEVNDFNIPPEDLEEEHECLIAFTTGSTGIPKAASRTHGFLTEVHKALERHLALKKEACITTTLPLFGISIIGIGMTYVLPALNPAKSIDFDCEIIIKQFLDCKVDIAIASPAFFEKIADYLIQKNMSLYLKQIFTGGAPVFPKLAKKLLKVFPKTKIEITYGSTESEPISGVDARKVAKTNIKNGLLVGKKVDFINLKIIKPFDCPIEIKKNESIENLCVSNDEIGEIIVSGAHVLTKYINSPEAFKENKIVDGNIIWHRTGDAGRIDKKGNIILFGRVKNRFYDKGKCIYTLPLEQKLLEIEDVSFAVVHKSKEKIYALLEVDEKLSEKQRKLIIQKAKNVLKDVNIDEYLIMQKIPRDPRHYSKGNYEELNKILK